MSGPDPADLRALAAEWLARAETDREAVRVCIAAGAALRPVAAFHAQQAAEKLMKGFLVLANTDFRKTHNLYALGETVAGRFPELESELAAMADWTAWGIAYRYPAESVEAPEPTEAKLDAALRAIDELAARLRGAIS
jgi:HEPN domain-containing protein